MLDSALDTHLLVLLLGLAGDKHVTEKSSLGLAEGSWWRLTHIRWNSRCLFGSSAFEVRQNTLGIENVPLRWFLGEAPSPGFLEDNFQNRAELNHLATLADMVVPCLSKVVSQPWKSGGYDMSFSNTQPTKLAVAADADGEKPRFRQKHTDRPRISVMK